MTVIQGLLLGFLQGVAEFLPISSSGHLTLIQQLFGLEEVPVLFDVFLHLATLAAVVLYFRKKIWNLLKVFGRFITRKPRPEGTENPEDLLTGTDFAGRKTILAIIITTVITAALGILTSKMLPELPVKVTCAGFLITAFFLIISYVISDKKMFPRRYRRFGFAKSEPAAVEVNETDTQEAQKPKGISIFQSIVIGIMQGLGTLPGISRSGSTIAGALYSGVDKKAAGDYSFLVSIPAILGAFILEVKDLGKINQIVGPAPVIAGCATAFAVGYISLALLMKIIRKGKLQWFAAYLIPLGIAGLFLF